MNIENRTRLSDPANVIARRAYLSDGQEPLEELALRIKRVGDALKALEELTGESTRHAVTSLQRELNVVEPSITFLGQVKSGKTSLVNAMAGWPDLLPSDVNPWTSVVTSLHLTPAEQECEIGAKFQFMEQGEWDRLIHKGGRLGELANRAGSGGELETIRQQIEMLREKSRARLGKKFELLLGQEHKYDYFDKNLLERYICIGDDFYDEEVVADDQGRFADITKSADLHLQCTSQPVRMCLRDTPGVNDTFMMREQVTINAVRSSRICVVVLSAHQALTSIDMALIRMISSLKSRDVIIFVNRIDELADPSSQIPEIEASIRQVLAENEGPKDAQIIFGSAIWAHAVLKKSFGELGSSSAASLLKMAEKQVETAAGSKSPEETIWHMSGLPKLYRVISERIVETVGNPAISKIASSAITIASGQQAANKVRVDGTQTRKPTSLNDVAAELKSLADRHKVALSQKIDAITEVYHSRADRAHANFVERATHSLISHLEAKSDGAYWAYSPAGLRMLLKSAYSVFASRAQNAAASQYEQAVGDIAELYFSAFGDVVEGIELNVPEVQEFPAPVSIAQTIALDFNDSWWVSWWRRTRGYKAFAAQFQTLVTAETEDFLSQLKYTQSALIRDQLLQTLVAYFSQTHDIMTEIGNNFETGTGVQRIFMNEREYQRTDQLEQVVADLRSCVGEPHSKGKEQ